MDIDELKKDLGVMTMGDLEEIGLLSDEVDEDDLILLHTPDDLNKLRNEVMWVAAANTDDIKIVILTNGLLYNEDQQEETGKEIEFGRIYLDETKAALIIRGIMHSFPDIVSDVLDILAEEEGDDEDLLDLPKPDNYELISVDVINGAKDLDTVIGNLKKCASQMELFKNKGYELVDFPEDNLIAISDDKDKILETEDATNDEIEELNKNIFKSLGGDIKTITNKTGQITYISTSQQKIKILNGNINDIANQGLSEDPLQYMNFIEINKKEAKELVSAMKKSFKE